MLVHQLRAESPSSTELEETSSKQLALEDTKGSSRDSDTSKDVSPVDLMQTSLNVKHCNSFNSDILEPKSENYCDTNSKEVTVGRIEKHLSAGSEVLGKFFYTHRAWMFLLFFNVLLCLKINLKDNQQQVIFQNYTWRC